MPKMEKYTVIFCDKHHKYLLFDSSHVHRDNDTSDCLSFSNVFNINFYAGIQAKAP